jgi:hypothetical protein
MREYGVTYKSIPLTRDSSSAICLSQNPVFHGRAKHVKVRHRFLRDHIEKGDIVMKFIDTERQLADNFTKPLVLPLCGGSLVFAITMDLFEGELVICIVYLYPFTFLLYFFMFT